MKRPILLFIALILSGMVALAQNSDIAGVNDIFEGKVVPRREMKRISVQGDRLAGLRLKEFVSVQFQADESRLCRISSIIADTAEKAPAKEIETDGATLTYAFITLQPSTEGLNRYLGYSAKTDGGEYRITVIYFYGSATAAELKDKLCK